MRSVTARSLGTLHAGAMGYDDDVAEDPGGGGHRRGRRAARSPREARSGLDPPPPRGSDAARCRIGERDRRARRQGQARRDRRDRRPPRLVGRRAGRARRRRRHRHDDAAPRSCSKQLGLQPRRTIRVVFWVNEENGVRGGEGLRRDAQGRAREDRARRRERHRWLRAAGLPRDRQDPEAAKRVVARIAEIATLLQPLHATRVQAGRRRHRHRADGGRRRAAGRALGRHAAPTSTITTPTPTRSTRSTRKSSPTMSSRWRCSRTSSRICPVASTRHSLAKPEPEASEFLARTSARARSTARAGTDDARSGRAARRDRRARRDARAGRSRSRPCSPSASPRRAMLFAAGAAPRVIATGGVTGAQSRVAPKPPRSPTRSSLAGVPRDDDRRRGSRADHRRERASPWQRSRRSRPRVWLVTQPFHARRAEHLFRAAGLRRARLAHRRQRRSTAIAVARCAGSSASTRRGRRFG